MYRYFFIACPYLSKLKVGGNTRKAHCFILLIRSRFSLHENKICIRERSVKRRIEMNIAEFKKSIEMLFGEHLHKYGDDEYGFTHISKDEFHKIGYTTNLTLETIEEARVK